MSTFALVIGVDSYRTLDPSGHDDLWGAENDARAWYRWLTTRLGVPTSSVRLLCTTPGADVSGAPTFAGIQEGLAHLAAQLRAAKAAGEPASAVVTFSGHGVAFGDTGTAGAGLGNTMGICPCDVTRDPSGEVVGAWRVGDLMATFGPDLVDDVTVVLDACYTTDPEGVRPHRSLSAPGVTPSGPPVPGRVLLACEPWAQAFEFTAGGERRGAFSVAMLTLLEQWSLRRDRGTYPNVNHGDLVYRARRLLGVLGVDQAPMLLGVARVELVPFLRPGLDIAMGTTSPEPDAHRHGAQLSVGTDTQGYRVYQLTAVYSNNITVPLATIISVGGVAENGYQANTEYWSLPTFTIPNGQSFQGYAITCLEPRTNWNDYAADAQSYNLSPNSPAFPIEERYLANMPWTPNHPLGTRYRPQGTLRGLDVELNPTKTKVSAIRWVTDQVLNPNIAGFLGSLHKGQSVAYTLSNGSVVGSWIQTNPS